MSEFRENILFRDHAKSVMVDSVWPKDGDMADI